MYLFTRTLSAPYSRATVRAFPELRINKSMSSTTLEQLSDMFRKLRMRQTVRDIFKVICKASNGGKVYHFQWEKPPKGWVKLNTDGSIKIPKEEDDDEEEEEEEENKKARATGAGIFRDSDGEPLLGFQTPLKVPYLPVKREAKKKPASKSTKEPASKSKKKNSNRLL